MKKLLGMFAILTFSVFAFAQDAPKQDAPKTEGEGRPRGEGRMQMAVKS